MNKTQTKKGSIYIRSLPESLKTAFKSKCAEYSMTMEKTIEILIRQYIQNPTKTVLPK